ncbi:hypothetical protein GTY87_32665 [Streptomyces sp. SID7813]|uniref:Uncharacterized protein n=1 Tax=Streptomyces coelicolor (strain ATCC BAA-471 / A3(2) / M145) TaxID=100226 RepID=O69921_STRCO|nr:hypothetical protein [Streptomyces sp. SID7813]NSL81189.1 hypothetical protein [Streptomyces coelicolor]QFI46196.1 hypothetical protein FQ762_32995 [Streptomyces coelicolor A3(2)]CAA19600.1 hypothetical protein SC3C8.08c [Streptomyces coelicolor A3(2)]
MIFAGAEGTLAPTVKGFHAVEPLLQCEPSYGDLRNLYVLPLVRTPNGTVTDTGCPDGTNGETMPSPTCESVVLSKIWKVPLALPPSESTNVSRSVGVVVLTVDAAVGAVRLADFLLGSRAWPVVVPTSFG